MIDLLINIMLPLVAAIRRLWQRLTRRPVPVPIPVRARYNSPFSTLLANQRAQADETRHAPRW